MKSDKKSKYSGPEKCVADHRKWALDQILVHTATGNEYKLKEIQEKGFIVLLIKTLDKVLETPKQAYISYTDLHEYK